jgi:glycosyltransferase involved in cell wall biosynthesis
MLSIVIPARNEAKRIPPMLESYGKFFSEKEKEGLKSEIIVVINNSSDDTLEVVKKFSEKYNNLRYMNLEPGGKGFATIMGFKEALNNYENKVIGFVDADMSTLPEDFYDLYKNIGDYSGIIASRWKKGAKVERSKGKWIRSRGFNFLVRSLFLFPYEDTQCGAKLFRKEAIESFVNHIEIPEWAFDVNILYLCKQNGFRIKEHPTIWEDKEGSAIDFINVPMRMAGGVIRLRLLNSPFEFIVALYDRLLAKRLKIHNLV